MIAFVRKNAKSSLASLSRKIFFLGTSGKAIKKWIPSIISSVIKRKPKSTNSIKLMDDPIDKSWEVAQLVKMTNKKGVTKIAQ